MLEKWQENFRDSGVICAVMVDSQSNEDNSIGRRSWDLLLVDQEELFKAYKRGVRQARKTGQLYAKRSFWPKVLRWPEDSDEMCPELRRKVRNQLREKFNDQENPS